MSSVVGKTLGKYRVLEKIGAGALADVYRGLQIGLDREVAIKVLPPALAADREMLARFKRESLSTARMSHPNIITVFDSGEQDGVHYYVMEHLRPESLADRLETQGPLSAERALKIVQDVLKALIYAHERDVAHRALGSGSVKFDGRGNAVLTDFAPAESGLTDPREDLEAVGEILSEMLTGQPVGEEVPLAKLDPSLPAELVALCDRALAADPASRFTTARDMLVEVKRIELEQKAHRIARAMQKARIAALAPSDTPAGPGYESDPWGFLSSLALVLEGAEERQIVRRTLWWLVPLLLFTVVITVWAYRLIVGV